MTDKRSENMRRLNADPCFAAARDDRARDRATRKNERMQRDANIAKRGCVVPQELEDRWRELKKMKTLNRDAARMLDIPYLGTSEDEADLERNIQAAVRVSDEQISYVEDLSIGGKIDEDICYELIEREKRLQRVLTWNLAGT